MNDELTDFEVLMGTLQQFVRTELDECNSCMAGSRHSGDYFRGKQDALNAMGRKLERLRKMKDSCQWENTKMMLQMFI